MNFSSNKEFCPYRYCENQYGLLPSDIEKIDEKRTYKNFVEFNVYLFNGRKIFFKAIIKPSEGIE